MKIAYPARLPDTSTETTSPESRRCLRRIFSLARHSRNTASPFLSLAESRKCLDWRFPPASGALEEGLKQKAPEFNEAGAEIYAKA
jgi:hypothetical protein